MAWPVFLTFGLFGLTWPIFTVILCGQKSRNRTTVGSKAAGKRQQELPKEKGAALEKAKKDDQRGTTNKKALKPCYRDHPEQPTQSDLHSSSLSRKKRKPSLAKKKRNPSSPWEKKDDAALSNDSVTDSAVKTTQDSVNKRSKRALESSVQRTRKSELRKALTVKPAKRLPSQMENIPAGYLKRKAKRELRNTLAANPEKKPLVQLRYLIAPNPVKKLESQLGNALAANHVKKPLTLNPIKKLQSQLANALATNHVKKPLNQLRNILALNTQKNLTGTEEPSNSQCRQDGGARSSPQPRQEPVKSTAEHSSHQSRRESRTGTEEPSNSQCRQDGGTRSAERSSPQPRQEPVKPTEIPDSRQPRQENGTRTEESPSHHHHQEKGTRTAEHANRQSPQSKCPKDKPAKKAEKPEKQQAPATDGSPTKKCSPEPFRKCDFPLEKKDTTQDKSKEGAELPRPKKRSRSRKKNKKRKGKAQNRNDSYTCDIVVDK
ncbi:hypothetical protein QR680_016502 [Steinernema hermaphroditum]|uniref:Uncharacterized protein n=1 Tax=Steinernema hermaphroditum TaxID=289476 RepID=A0AA39HDW4_9BILA|nr:hypothetical protein QR680_016502 [Steinernema hermaphroditum]